MYNSSQYNSSQHPQEAGAGAASPSVTMKQCPYHHKSNVKNDKTNSSSRSSNANKLLCKRPRLSTDTTVDTTEGSQITIIRNPPAASPTGIASEIAKATTNLRHFNTAKNNSPPSNLSFHKNSKSINQSNENSCTTSTTSEQQNSTPLTFLCLSKSWIAATKRAQSHPHEAQYGCTSSARSLLPLGGNTNNTASSTITCPDNDDALFHTNSNNIMNNYVMASSPLALVTRYGAPSFCIEAVLNAEKRMVRRCIPNRGTPLHEAIMLYPNISTTTTTVTSQENLDHNNDDEMNNSINDQIQEYVKIVRMLIKADESIDQTNYDKDNENGSSSGRTCSNSSSKKRRKYFNSSSTCGSTSRATLLQDVDGNVPLHLLIRQAFYNYLGTEEQQMKNMEHPILTVARELIQSSPEAVSIPDCTEFEETPLILVLKSSVYANEQHEQRQRRLQNIATNNNSDEIDYYNATLERKIFDICKIMLQSSPHAASRVMVQNGYTAVHSAVFHGRCCDIIRLLLNADEVNRKRNFYNNSSSISSQSQSELCADGSVGKKKMEIPATMQANKFGELPLHIAAMRGECTRSIALLSQNAPWAVLRRDVKLGLTPMHWLWVRFMDRVIEKFGLSQLDVDNEEEEKEENNNDDELKMDGNNEDVSDHDLGNLSFGNPSTFSASNSEGTSTLAEFMNSDGDIHFDLEYHIRTEAIDPPVTYTRMRHIVPEYLKLEKKLTNRVVKVLRDVRARHKRMMDRMLQLQRQLVIEKHDDDKNNKSQDTGRGINNPQDSSNFKSREEFPFTGVINQEPQDSHLKSIPKCPYAHLAKKTSNESNCPYVNNNQILLANNLKDPYNPNKKCPFRCPFVSDSYPLSENLTHSAEEESLREEQVISLFWAKVTSLLHAAAVAKSLDIDTAMSSPDLIEQIDFGKIHMLHTACSTSCPVAIVRMCLELCHEQLTQKDSTGKLPLHHAASRLIDIREYPYVTNEKHNSSTQQRFGVLPRRSNVIEYETNRVLKVVLESSPSNAAMSFDSENRLPLHYMIDSIVMGMIQYTTSASENSQPTKGTFDSFFQPLKTVINVYPDALESLDGKTQIFPFMQASAFANDTLKNVGDSKGFNTLSLSLVYSLLLEKPSILTVITPLE